MLRRPFSIALRTALLYALIAALWILLSDQALALFVSSPQWLTTLQTYKGWAFVGVTALLLYTFLHRQFFALEHYVIERQQKEVSLRQSEYRYRMLFEQNNDAIFLIGLDRVHFMANQRAAEMFGYSVDELVGMNIRQLVAPEALEQTHNVMNRLLAKEKIPIYERLFVKKDGTRLVAEVNVDMVRDLRGNPLHIQSICHDITERKQAEEKLRQSEERYRAISNLTSDYAYSFRFEPDETFTREWTTEAFFKITGYSPTDPQFKNGIGSIVHPDDRHLLEERNRRDVAGEEVNAITHRIVRKDGEIRWLYNFGKSTRDESTGKIMTFYGVVQDITERKRAEMALQESQAQIAGIVASAMDAIISINAEHRIVLFNPAAETIFRCAAAEAINQPLEKFIPERFRASHAQHVRDFALSGITNRSLGKLGIVIGLRSDGVEFPIEASISQTNVASGDLYTVILRDITERVRTETRLRRFWDLPLIGMAITSTDRRFLEVNQKFADMMGYTVNEFAGTAWPDVTHPDDVAENTRLLQETLDGKTDGYAMEKRFIRRDGTLLQAHIAARCIRRADGTVDHLAFVIQDITERKQHERERLLLDRVRATLARELDLPIILHTVVEAIAETFGYTLVSLYLQQGEVLVLQHQVGYSHVINEIPITQGITGRVVRTRQPVLIEDVHADPTFLGAIEGIVSEVCIPLFDESQVVGTLNVESTQGVKLSEADLNLMTALSEHIGLAIGRARLYTQVRQSEERYRHLFENSPIGIYRTTPDGRIIASNPALVRMLGFSSFEDVAARNLEQDSSDAAYPRRVFKEQIEREGHITGLETVWRKRDGMPIFVRENAQAIRDETGAVMYYDGTIEDITERVKAEETLRQTHQLLETVFDNTHLMFAYLDPQFNFLRVNRAYAQADERGASFYVGKNHFDLFPNEENQIIFQRVVDSGEPHFSFAKPFEYAEHPERGVSHWDWSLVPIKDTDGKTAGLILSLLNVTERVQAEEALRESEKRFRNLVETTTDWIWEIDEHGIYTYASPRILDTLGYEPAEIIGKTPSDLMPPDEAQRVTDIFLPIRAARSPFSNLENINRHKDGHLVALETSGIPLVDKDGKFCGYRGIDRDITQRKQAEESERQHNRQINLLYEASRHLNRTLDLDEIYHLDFARNSPYRLSFLA